MTRRACEPSLQGHLPAESQCPIFCWWVCSAPRPPELSSLGLGWICPLLSLPGLADDSFALANATRALLEPSQKPYCHLGPGARVDQRAEDSHRG